MAPISRPGIYSSFLRHAVPAAQMYGVGVRKLLVEVGGAALVAAQEDLIVDIAFGLLNETAWPPEAESVRWRLHVSSGVLV